MGRLFVALVAIPFLADLLDRVVAWAQKKYRQQIEEGDEFPPFSWVLWVRVTHRNPDYDHDLWVIKLPCYQWREVNNTGECAMTQLSFFNRRPFQRRELFNGAGWQAGWLVR